MAELVNPAPADVPCPHVLPAFAAAFIERVRPAGEQVPGSFQVWLAGFEKLVWF
ncbi:MAG: hypothetical protein HS126_21980 [Anaerolineales bacterium]|nr:hypothetical protein [Anaerolineales bacterium]